ncbi:MAG: M20/M25/M40 family metallo-hydrolase [Flavobacteriia bacterium]|nr:M20/M25/M40 family metallo-hydrolase [Flavobacteriia bacterium]
MLKQNWILILILLPFLEFSQNDSLFIRKIYDECLEKGHSYEDLRSLCKEIGPRLSGSPQAQMSVFWSEEKMNSYGFDKVYKQEIKVPVWKRGNKETAWIKKEKEWIPLHILALGGSVSTNGLLSGELVIFQNLDELKKANPKNVEGKIVFLNQTFDQKDINTFKAYGGCYSIRGEGAIEGAKKGAKGVLIRSLASGIDTHPHTGSMHYDDNVKKIPAAAVSTSDAELLQNIIGKIELFWEMDCFSGEEVTSYNVIAEITGTKLPNEIITFGGHLDSWDVGEGAHDDGAGVIHCLEALRVLKALNYKPQHTLRVVFFMNEENGNKGGLGYAEWVKNKGEKHIFALESDRGGFTPKGFSCDGNFNLIKEKINLYSLYKPYEVYEFEKGYGGVDINPLKKMYPDILLFGFVPDSQRYFDFHHAESDVFEAVNKRELELGCAAITSFIYLLDNL